MNDALGNPIVFGEKYTFLDVNLSLAYGARVTGVALKTLKGKCGDKITLKILLSRDLRMAKVKVFQRMWLT